MSDQSVTQDAASAAQNVMQTLVSVKGGDTINWNSPIRETFIYTELPFWLMIPEGDMEIEWRGHAFQVRVCPSWREIFFQQVTDSRSTVYHHGPRGSGHWTPDAEAAEFIEMHDVKWLERPCKTVVRIAVQAHSDAFESRANVALPRAHYDLESYWASLCEAHVPVLNELIQRYRLATYDYFAYEVSPWDVPVWYLKYTAIGKVLISPYKAWDQKPDVYDDLKNLKASPKKMQYASLDDLSGASKEEATPGEFDLLDARSLMERGDYTGAVRRTVTAVETLTEWSLSCHYLQNHSEEETRKMVKKTKGDFAQRLTAWQNVSGKTLSDVLVKEFAKTRKTRHQIVHAGRRLTHEHRNMAQRSVDAGRWLFNHIEDIPHRARLRDYGTIKAVGRVALSPRFPVTLKDGGFLVEAIS